MNSPDSIQPKTSQPPALRDTNPRPNRTRGGGKVSVFELRATIRVIGDNNPGIQYRSRELPNVAPWVITGYQCDIHPAIEHTGMTYEERGRGIFGLSGKNVLLDPDGARWMLSEHDPVVPPSKK